MHSDCRGGDIHGSTDMAMAMRVMGKRDMERTIRKVIENRLRDICGYFEDIVAIQVDGEPLSDMPKMSLNIHVFCNALSLTADILRQCMGIGLSPSPPLPQNVVDSSCKLCSGIP